MTPLTRLRELMERATPGPYWFGHCEPADGHALFWCGNHFVDTEAPKVNGSRYRDANADVELVATALNALPALIQIAEAGFNLRKYLDRGQVNSNANQQFLAALRALEEQSK
jgi:hypothetical protein